MFTSVLHLLPAVARATLALSLSAGIAQGLLAWFKPQSPRLRRIIWMLVLLQGIILLRIPIAIPWYAPDTDSTLPSIVSAVPSAAPDIIAAKSSAHPAPAIVQNSNSPFDWRSIVCGIWLAGCAVTLTSWVLVYVRVSRRVARSQEPSQEWASQWQELLDGRAVKSAIPLRITDDLAPLLAWRPGGTVVRGPRGVWVRV